jgi:hypothetical protein
MMGAGRRLKEYNANIKVITVEPVRFFRDERHEKGADRYGQGIGAGPGRDQALPPLHLGGGCPALPMLPAGYVRVGWWAAGGHGDCDLFPPGGGRGLQDHSPAGLRVDAPKGGHLGERLSSAFEHPFFLGYERVVAIGADSPTLLLAYTGWSFELLAGTELALGLSADGGCYLIGMKAFHPELFQGVAMGTERVLSQTLERARRPNLRVSLLPPWYEVETQDDLERLRAELRAAPQVAMHTRPFLCREVS